MMQAADACQHLFLDAGDILIKFPYFLKFLTFSMLKVLSVTVGNLCWFLAEWLS